jgi:hypothetical protein
MFSNPVCVSGRGYMNFVANDLDESVNIISDDSWLESIQLGIILEDIEEEGDVLQVMVSLNIYMM